MFLKRSKLESIFMKHKSTCSLFSALVGACLSLLPAIILFFGVMDARGACNFPADEMPIVHEFRIYEEGNTSISTSVFTDSAHPNDNPGLLKIAEKWGTARCKIYVVLSQGRISDVGWRVEKEDGSLVSETGRPSAYLNEANCYRQL